MKERAIAQSIMKWLRAQPETICWKVNDATNVGFPDIVGCCRGLLFTMEVKTTKGRLSKRQEYEGLRIVNAGGYYAVVRSLDEARQNYILWFVN